MDGSEHSVNIGPISLFTLVASLGMAVLAVLAISTSNAMYALAQRSATMTAEVYQADVCGQRFVEQLDAALAQAQERGSDVYAYVSSQLPAIVVAAQQEGDPYGMAEEAVQVSADMIGTDVVATVQTPAARRIDLRVTIAADGTYQIVEWKATSEADSTGTQDVLWTPEG